MSGYMFAYGPCWMCGRHFTFDPERVPSIGIDPEYNLPADLVPKDEIEEAMKRKVQEPLCPDCIGRVNESRERQGHEPIFVLPGAYGPLDPTG